MLSQRKEFSNIVNKMKETHNSIRLAAIADYGGKTRVVSIGTHTIQILLKPYHSYMMKLLRCLKEDCSYDQSKVGPIIRKWTSEGRHIESIDLSKATDRFPSVLQ